MAYLAQVSYTGDGSTVGYSLPFTYIATTHIKAYIAGVETSAFTVSGSTVTFTSAPANLAVVKIERVTPTDARLVDFQDGSVLTESDLDQSADQNFFTVQEMNGIVQLMNDLDKNIHTAKETKNPIAKILWILLGSFFVMIGAIGAVIPGLPTTLFLILAAACYIRSSQKLYDWLITNKTFGPYLKDYREGKGIPRRAKKIALIMMTIFVGYAVLFALDDLIVRIVVLVLGMIGFYYVAYRVPSAKE